MAELTLSRRDLLDFADTTAALTVTSDESAAIAETVRQPDKVIRVLAERPGERAAHDIWLGREFVVHQAELPPNDPAVATFGPRGLMPSIVGRIVDLGPRLNPQGGSAVIHRHELALSLDRGEEVNGFGRVAVVWTLQVVGHDHLAFTVVDGGLGESIWCLQAATEDDRWLFRETSPYDLWARLGALLR